MKTIVDLLENSAQKYGDNPYILEKKDKRYEAATRETIRDGWLYTGDMGYMDQDGFLYVLGRYKSLLISDDGEKYSPEGIEETITDRSALLDQMMLYNNQNKYTTALVVPNRDALARWAKGKNISMTDETGPASILNEIKSVFNQYMPGGIYADLFPSRWLPSAIAILDEPFNADNKQLNSLGKMVRARIIEKHKDTIEYLYTAEAKNIVNPRNLESIRRILMPSSK